MIRILITRVSGMGSIGWIKAIKAIKNQSIVLFGCDFIPYGYSSGSILVDRFIQSPSINDAEAYCSFLCDICNSNHIDLVLSVFDDELELLYSISNKISSKLIIPDSQTIRLFRDKKRATIEIEKLGISVPNILTSLFNEEMIIFRPITSIGSRGITVIDLKTEEYIKNYFNSDYFLQRYIKGNEYTVDVIADINGKPKMIIPRKRIEIRQGISFKCQIEYNTRLINNCWKIYEKIHLPGITNVQFITTHQKDYFIELNPRLGGTAIASVLSSFNFVEPLIENVLYGKEMDSYENNMKKVKWGTIVTRYYEETIHSSL